MAYNLVTPIEVTEVITSSTFDSSLITEKFIESTQKRHIEPVLNNIFYEVLTDTSTYSELIDGCIYTNSSEYKKQLSGLKETIKYLVYYDMLSEIEIELRNRGVAVNSMRDAESVTLDQLTRKQSDVYSRAKILLQEITDYLVDSDNSIYDNYDSGLDINNFKL